MTKTKNIIKKICVLGEEAVGKTSLIRRFVVEKFDDKYIATIGTKSSKKTLSIKSGDIDIHRFCDPVLGRDNGDGVGANRQFQAVAAIGRVGFCAGGCAINGDGGR